MRRSPIATHLSDGLGRPRHASIERLIRMAFEAGLISDYRMTPTQVRLTQAEVVVVDEDPEAARQALLHLLRREEPVEAA